MSMLCQIGVGMRSGIGTRAVTLSPCADVIFRAMVLVQSMISQVMRQHADRYNRGSS